MTAKAEGPAQAAPDVDAERLNQPLPARFVAKHDHNQFAGINRADLVHLMNRIFGPAGWRNEILRTEVLRDAVLPPTPAGDERLARYVSATAIVRVSACTAGGEIVREGMGVVSQARMLPDKPPKGPGTHGSDALQMAVLGAATSGFKHACYLIGRAVGGELGELGYRELVARGAEPSAAPFDQALHDRQPAAAKEMAKALSERARQAPSRQAAEAAIRGAREKLIKAGAQERAAEQIVQSLSRMAMKAGKKARGS